MALYPPPLARLIASLSRLPDWVKTAARLARHFRRPTEEVIQELARTLVQLKEKIRSCSICFNLTYIRPLSIVPQNQGRSSEILCVVEGPGDLMALEKAGGIKGKYHVLQGTLSPIDSVGPRGTTHQGTYGTSRQRRRFHEVVLAINPPSSEGKRPFLF